MAAPSNWDSYFQQCGLNPAKLKEQRIVELKCGDKQIQFPFSMEQFLMQYVPQNNNLFTADKLVDDVIYDKSIARYEVKVPPSRQAMFLEGSPVQKIKKGVFSKKSAPYPDRQFLLFKDEYLKEIPAPNNKIAQKAGNLWPFHYVPPPMESIIAAGKLYSTGKRIILDAYYTESLKDIEFATMQLWGKIDFQNCAKIFDKPYFTLRKYVKSTDPKQKGTWAPFNAIGLENEVEKGYVQEAVRVLNVKTIGISGTEKFYTEIKSMLKDLDGNKCLQTSADIYGLSGQLDEELRSLQPVNLEDILAMWQFAAKSNYFQATISGLGVNKGQISLRI
jgi:hypothetical protein